MTDPTAFEIWANLVIPALVGVAGVAVAIAAWRSSSVATRIAAEAHAVALRIDERGREVRNVHWDVGVEITSKNEMSTLALRNSGTTRADAVMVLLSFDGAHESHQLGAIEPGEIGRCVSPGLGDWMQQHREWAPVHPDLRVHWTSPMGQPEQLNISRRSMYMFPDDGDY